MLEGISVKNYRTFSELTEFSLAPITILLGANSSGKSSITRLLPLFSQSLTQRTAAPILWVSDSLDYGSFADNVTDHDMSRQITFSFKGRGPRLSRSRNLNVFATNPVANSDFRYSIDIAQGFERTTAATVEIEIFSQVVRLESPNVGFVRKIYHNGRDVSYALRDRVGIFRDGLFPNLFMLRKQPGSGDFDIVDADEFVFEGADMLRGYAHANTSRSKVLSLYRGIPFCSPEDMRNVIYARSHSIPSLHGRVHTIPEHAISHLWLLKFLENYASVANGIREAIAPDITSGQYLGPIRAQAARYYRRQELAVDQIDPTGENLAMYLNSLGERERAEINNDLLKFFGYTIKVHPGEGHISLRIAAEGDEEGDNLADVGFGFSQLLPVIAQVHAATRSFVGYGRLPSSTRAESPILAVEQPELHLHPAYQAKLGSYFVHAATNSTAGAPPFRFLIETHSEPLVNEVAAAVARGDIAPKDVNIYLFERQSKRKQTRVIKAEVQRDGTIPNWPFGFFTSGRLRDASGLQ